MDTFVQYYRAMNPTLYERQWHLHGRSKDGLVVPQASINCEQAWDEVGDGTSDVVVALADDGCQTSHPIFGGKEKFVGGAFKTDNGWRFESTYDLCHENVFTKGLTHGTSMAALIAGTGKHGSIGVAPRCRLLPIRMPMGRKRVNIDDHDILSILDVIDEYCDIALLSWSKLPVFIPSREVLDRCASIAEHGGRRGCGVVFFIPAGNCSCPISWEADQPIPYDLCESLDGRSASVVTSKTFRNLLTSIPNVLHVSAITSRAQRALYSCYGPGIDLCAPSSNSRPFSKEQIHGHKAGLTTSYGPDGEITEKLKGTSGAAALVAGVAALALGVDPDLSAEALADLLIVSASKDLDGHDAIRDLIDVRPGEWSPVAPFHHGGFDSSGWSPWFGFGKIDAEQVVKTINNRKRS